MYFICKTKEFMQYILPEGTNLKRVTNIIKTWGYKVFGDISHQALQVSGAADDLVPGYPECCPHGETVLCWPGVHTAQPGSTCL